MSITNKRKLKNLSDKVKAAFAKANPDWLKRVQGNEKAIRAVRQLEDRTQTLEKTMHMHCQKHKQQWIAKETVKVWEEREQANLNHPTPLWGGEPIHNSCLQEARQRIHWRIKGRMQHIRSIAQQMHRNLLIKHQKVSRQKPNMTYTLLIQLHYIKNRARNVREKAKNHFTRNKKQWIKNARKQGKKKPERAVYKRLNQRMNKIKTARKNMLRNVYERHRHPVPEKYQQQTLTQSYNRSQ